MTYTSEVKRFLAILDYLKENKLISNGSEFCIDMGIPKSSITELKKGRNRSVAVALIEKVITKYGISRDWIYGGIGPMFLKDAITTTALLKAKIEYLEKENAILRGFQHKDPNNITESSTIRQRPKKHPRNQRLKNR